jgi:hypothetical protein
MRALATAALLLALGGCAPNEFAKHFVPLPGAAELAASPALKHPAGAPRIDLYSTDPAADATRLFQAGYLPLGSATVPMPLDRARDAARTFAVQLHASLVTLSSAAAGNERVTAAFWVEQDVAKIPLGVHATTVPEAAARSPAQRRGAFVDVVVHGAPAEAAGIEAGDVIVKVAGWGVYDPGMLDDLAARYAGQSVAFVLMRGDAERTLRVRLNARP